MTTHVAGVVVKMGTQLRQRCAWCELVLVNVPDTRLWDEGLLPVHRQGSLVCEAGERTFRDDAGIPADFCGHEVVLT